MLEVSIGVFIFILGACIGSFLNVCIVRMPLEQSIVAPRSHCLKCQKIIPWFDNIPLVSYFILGGKCRSCGAHFSFRYVFVEFLTACAFLGFYLYFGLVPELFAYLVMLSLFIAATFTDFEHRIIPDEISVGGMFAGLVLSMFLLGLHDTTAQQLAVGRNIMRVLVAISLGVHLVEFLWTRKPFDREDWILLAVILGLFLSESLIAFLLAGPLAESTQGLTAHLRSTDASLIGLLLGGGMIYVLGLIGDVIFRKESMGGGDVKLMALVGAFLGWQLAALTFFIAPFVGAGYGIVEKIRTKDSAIAFGPFLVLGALVSLFYGEALIQWWLAWAGIVR